MKNNPKNNIKTIINNKNKSNQNLNKIINSIELYHFLANNLVNLKHMPKDNITIIQNYIPN